MICLLMILRHMTPNTFEIRAQDNKFYTQAKRASRLYVQLTYCISYK